MFLIPWCVAVALSAPVPVLIPVQGSLTQNDGAPLEGTHAIDLAVWADAGARDASICCAENWPSAMSAELNCRVTSASVAAPATLAPAQTYELTGPRKLFAQANAQTEATPAQTIHRVRSSREARWAVRADSQ